MFVDASSGRFSALTFGFCYPCTVFPLPPFVADCLDVLEIFVLDIKYKFLHVASPGRPSGREFLDNVAYAAGNVGLLQLSGVHVLQRE